MQSIPCKHDSTQMCWQSDTLRFLAHCRSMSLSDYSAQEDYSAPVLPHPYLWNLREEGKRVAQWWCFTHNPQSLWVHRLPLWKLPSHIGVTLRPITHTHSLKYYSSAWNAWMLDYCAVDRVVQLLDSAMRLCLHLRKTIQWNQSQWEFKIVPWWKCVGFKIEILDALRG